MGAAPGGAGRAVCVIDRQFRWDQCRLAPATWFPARSRAGIQAFSRESPDAKSRGGMPPRPPMFKACSLSLARFGGCATLFRSWGYFEAHLRALIWILFLRKQSLGGESISLRGHTYLRRLPLGGKLSPKVTDEGAILYPTFPCRRIRLSPGRRSSPAPLGESVAPSSAPVCALGHLPPEGKALGVGNPPIGYPIPFRPTDSPGRACLAEFRRLQPAEKDKIMF